MQHTLQNGPSYDRSKLLEKMRVRTGEFISESTANEVRRIKVLQGHITSPQKLEATKEV